MDRLSQALAAGFNAPVVYINRLTGFWLHLRRSARCVISRWQWGPRELIAGGQERQWLAATWFVGSPLVLPGS